MGILQVEFHSPMISAIFVEQQSLLRDIRWSKPSVSWAQASYLHAFGLREDCWLSVEPYHRFEKRSWPRYDSAAADREFVRFTIERLSPSDYINKRATVRNQQ